MVRVLVDGYQPRPSKEAASSGWGKRDERTGAFRDVRAASGPPPSEKLPKTTSSVSVPKK
jgi:hypothetical protein